MEKSIFQQICDEKNLRKAWIKARYYASTAFEYFDTFEYSLFEEYLDENIKAISHLLLSDEYSFNLLRTIQIPKKSGESRVLYFPTPQDNVVTVAVLNIIGPVFEKGFSTKSFGNRLNIAESESKNPFLDWYEQYTKYMSQCLEILSFSSNTWYEISDIENFYPTIDKAVLMASVAEKISDPVLLNLINRLLNLKAIDKQGNITEVLGLPAGTIHAHFFANLYLDKFDRFMESRSTNYARYVDDFCFSIDGENNLSKLNSEIEDFFMRKLGNIRTNESKTEKKPITDVEALIKHSQKLKYDLRFGVIESIDFDISSEKLEEVDKYKKRAEVLFRDLFLKVEKEEDISKIAKEAAGFIANKLQNGIINNEQALSIAYGILQANPPKTTAIRALLGCLIHLSNENNPYRLMNFLRGSSDLTKITYLQLLLGVDNIEPEIMRFLLDELSNDSNYLVRANVYPVIAEHSLQLSVEEIRELTSNEESTYVLARLLCLVGQLKEEKNKPIWTDLRTFLSINSSEIVKSVVFTLDILFSKRATSPESLDILFKFIFEHPSIDLFVDILLLRLVSRYGSQAQLMDLVNKFGRKSQVLKKSLTRTSAVKTIQYLLVREEISSLFRFCDALTDLELFEEAILGYQEIATKSGNPELQNQARSIIDKLNFDWFLPGLPNWYRLEVDKGVYLDYAGEPDYLCRYYDDKTNRRQGTLEILPVEKILTSKEFQSVDAWFNYLEQLNDAGVISLVDKGILQNEEPQKVYMIYEFKEGFSPFSKLLSSLDSGWEEKRLIDIALQIIEALLKTTNHNGFSFYNVNPSSVLWNSSGIIKLANLGSNLISPKYICGIHNCSKPTYEYELGKTTAQYYLGLLLLQIHQIKNCPIKYIGNSANGKSSLLDTINKLQFTPHFKSILVRMLNTSPELRYSSMKVLQEDLCRILEFKEKYESLNLTTPISAVEKIKKVFMLLDFVSFRLSVIFRNPRLINSSPIFKVEEVLESLSNDLNYYPSSELKLWRTRIDWLQNKDKLPSYLTWIWLTPESRSFFGIMVGWLELKKILSANSSISINDQLSSILIAHIVHIESIAFVRGVLSANPKNKGMLEEGSKFTKELSGILEQGYQKIFMSRGNDKGSDPLLCPYNINHIGEVRDIISANYEKEWAYLRLQQSSLTGLLGTVVLLGLNVEIRNEKNDLLSNGLDWLNLWKKQKSNIDLLLLSRWPSIIENNIVEIFKGNEMNVTFDEFLYQCGKFLDHIRVITPCKRIRGNLMSFQAISSPKEGRVRFSPNNIRTIQSDFSEKNVFTNGDLIISNQSKRFVQIDIVKTNKTYKVSSVFAFSKLFSSLESDPAKMGTVSKFAKWINKNNLLILITVILTTLSCYAINYSLEQPKSSTDIWVKSIVGLVILIMEPLLLATLKTVVSRHSPEDAKHLEVT